VPPRVHGDDDYCDYADDDGEYDDNDGDDYGGDN
jgi:hypothetical protein